MSSVSNEAKTEPVEIATLQQTRDIFGNDKTTRAKIKREPLAAALAHEMRNLSLDQFAGLLTNIHREIVEYACLLEGESGVCQKLSLLFNPHRLDTVGGNQSKGKESKQSVFSALQDEGFCSGLARTTLLHRDRRNTHNLLQAAIEMGINGVRYVGEFPPHVARDLCFRYGLNSGSKVLDPCAGWGGRMIGCSAVVDHYFAWEPSTRTHSGLTKLHKFLQQFRPSFNAVVTCGPFEDATPFPQSFDMALTSPPYYDTEKYSVEPTNSLNRYPNFDAWSAGFYYPLIKKTMKALKPGAPFVLNIGSRIWPLEERLLSKFGSRFKIKRLGAYLSSNHGLGKKKDCGETFLEIRSE